MKKLFLLLLFSFHLCLNAQDKPRNLDQEEAAIYSLLIDRMARPFPPPPPPPKDGSEPKPINFDSIRKVKVEVVVDTVMFDRSGTVDLQEKFPEFQNLVDSISSLAAKPVNFKYIMSEEGHTLIFGNSLEDSQTRYSQMVEFSRIAFNEEENMAALYAGHSTHPLSSYVDLYLLKKIKGEWKIVFEKTLEVS